MKLGFFGLGKMGVATAAAALERGHEIILQKTSSSKEVDHESLARCDVVIDFTHPSSVLGNVELAADASVDLVVGTTGWLDHLNEVERLVQSKDMGLLYGSNFSLGVHAFLRVSAYAAQVASKLEGVDVSVHEIHHRHKVDRPSGTAITLAEHLLDELPGKGQWSADLPIHQAVNRDTLYVSSQRCGENPGFHSVSIDGSADTIAVRHQARNRSGFAHGAVEAAEWLHGRQGLYSLEQWLADRFS